jgi:hypothetical protein
MARGKCSNQISTNRNTRFNCYGQQNGYFGDSRIARNWNYKRHSRHSGGRSAIPRHCQMSQVSGARKRFFKVLTLLSIQIKRTTSTNNSKYQSRFVECLRIHNSRPRYTNMWRVWGRRQRTILREVSRREEGNAFAAVTYSLTYRGRGGYRIGMTIWKLWDKQVSRRKSLISAIFYYSETKYQFREVPVILTT